MTLYCGIDPGLSGAVAFYSDGPFDVEVWTYDTPVFDITVNGKVKRQIDLQALNNLFLDRPVALVTIEDVHSMPEQGVTSSFNFGFAAGVAHGVCAAHRIPMKLVRPSIWKRVMGLTADKDASRALASRIFPAAASQWSLKKHDGRAEAALLAFYGSKFV